MSQRNTEVVSLSLPGKLVEQMEDTIEQMGYPSRSEFVRDSLRAFFTNRSAIESIEGKVDGLIILFYNHKAAANVGEVRHRNMGIIRSFMHSDLATCTCEDCTNDVCCEVLIFSGEGEKVRKAFYELRSLKGVERAEVFMPSMERCEGECGC